MLPSDSLTRVNTQSVINLAREVGATTLLPAAFYELSKYTYAQIFEPLLGDPLYPIPSHSSSSPTLSMRDVQSLTVGKECSQQAITGLIQAMTTDFYRDYTLGSQAQFGHQQRKPSDRVCLCPAACKKDLYELTELATNHYLFDREKGC